MFAGLALAAGCAWLVLGAPPRPRAHETEAARWEAAPMTTTCQRTVRRANGEVVTLTSLCTAR